MFKIAAYIDGPTINPRTDKIRFAMLYDDTSPLTDITIDGVVKYKFISLAFSELKTGGTTISPEVFLQNINKFTYSNNTLSFSGGTLDNNKLDVLDDTIPLSCLRANTVVNLGRL